MKRSILALVLILSASLSDAKVQHVCDEVFLQVSLTDPTEDQKPIKRSPVVIPSVSLEGHNLIFATSCDGCILRLLNEDGDVEYMVVRVEFYSYDTGLPTQGVKVEEKKQKF